ncbi:MAG: DUF4335 domain-containing protein [Oscillatoriophycideae cyanobacterium NC_groundwater_1537_Pr4_S-0.65um_50_18]|nr:DUF4335 domain-containing protein [Oscillatoriophycideae cyanobacterium NC_groundwater_1537_Pr4_S-0.65um_50_18]
MSIQRQYSLPSCKLILEGQGNPTPNSTEDASGSFARPLVSEVSNVECYFSGYEKPLTGGRAFLESLASTVSIYAQEFLSGIPHGGYGDRPNAQKLVELERVDRNLHRLKVQPQVDSTALSTTPQQFDLTTVQLFDLVEAIDRLNADAQTLPDFKLNLAPVPKRYVAAQEPIAKRAAAPALGTAGLAIAALALFFVPPPPVQRPEPAGASPQSTTVLPSTSPSGASPGAGSPSPDAGSPSPEVAVPSPGAGTADEQTAAALLTTLPEITDPAEQERLKTALYEKIDPAWTVKPTFQEPLEYQVGVAANGDLVGYSFLNEQALQYRQEIPLLELLRVPVAAPETAGANNQEAIARFRVVFEPNGVLEVSPWYGQAAPVESSPVEGGSTENNPVASPSP